jgi:hypothetical protein
MVRKRKKGTWGLKIYVMMKGFWIPACLKNVCKDLMSRQLRQLDEWRRTVP